MQKKKSDVFGFGKTWLMIIFCFFSFLLYGGMTNDSPTNIVIPAIAEKFGMPVGTLLGYVTVATIIGAICLLFTGMVNKKIGPRYTSAICLVILGIGYFGLGHASSIGTYFISEVLVLIGGPGAAYIAAGALTAQWFPKKSGVVMGYTTAGLNFSSMLFVPMSQALVSKLGVSKGVILPAILAIVLAIIALVFVRNTPQEKNIYPDNVTAEIYSKEYYENKEKEKNWKISRMMKKPIFWQVAFASGLFQAVTAIVISQLITRGGELGFSTEKAVFLMSVCSVIGFIGSWLVGVLDIKLGTKKAMYILGVWYIVALLFNWSGVTILAYIFYGMYGIALGGSANFMSSLPINVFGRQLFEKLNVIMCPIQIIIGSLGVLTDGAVLNATGSLRQTYLVGVAIVIVNMILIATVKEHKCNPDFMSKEESDKFMDSIGANSK